MKIIQNRDLKTYHGMPIVCKDTLEGKTSKNLKPRKALIWVHEVMD